MALTLKQMVDNRRLLRTGAVPSSSFIGIKKTVALPAGNFIAIQAQFNAQSENSDISVYDTVISFQNIAVQHHSDELFNIEVADKSGSFFQRMKGNKVYMMRPSYTQTPVTVTCLCPDFYWVWWYYIDQKQGLAGQRFPYPSEVTGRHVRKKDSMAYGSVPGSRNDAKAAGVCKHLVYLSKHLLWEKWITMSYPYSPDASIQSRQSRRR